MSRHCHMPSGTSEDTLGRASTGVPGKRTSLQEQATPWDTITRTVNPSAYAYPGSNPGPATVVRAHFRVSSGRRRVKLCHTSRLTLRRARRTLVRPSKQSLAVGPLGIRDARQTARRVRPRGLCECTYVAIVNAHDAWPSQAAITAIGTPSRLVPSSSSLHQHKHLASDFA